MSVGSSRETFFWVFFPLPSCDAKCLTQRLLSHPNLPLGFPTPRLLPEKLSGIPSIQTHIRTSHGSTRQWLLENLLPTATADIRRWPPSRPNYIPLLTLQLLQVTFLFYPLEIHSL